MDFKIEVRLQFKYLNINSFVSLFRFRYGPYEVRIPFLKRALFDFYSEEIVNSFTWSERFKREVIFSVWFEICSWSSNLGKTLWQMSVFTEFRGFVFDLCIFNRTKKIELNSLGGNQLPSSSYVCSSIIFRWILRCLSFKLKWLFE